MPRFLLALLYNHRYEANVPRLNALYRDQFDTVRHLMPFAEATTPDVVPVFDSSYRFGNFVAQSAERLLEDDADYFVFAGDDLLLSPVLTSASAEAELGLTPDTGFIKYWTGLADTSWWWYHVHRGYAPLEDPHSGVEWQSQLPPYAEAAARLQRHGWEDRPLTPRNFRIPPPVLRSRRAAARAVGQLVRRRGAVRPAYPLAMGYADFFVVPRQHLGAVARYSGVLSAAGVFAEVAVPTALLLALPSVATSASSRAHGHEYWTPEAISGFEELHGRSLDRLRRSMVDDDILWHHPVKLSRWSDS